jgi:hypothetical protein
MVTGCKSISYILVSLLVPKVVVALVNIVVSAFSSIVLTYYSSLP